MKYTEGTIHIGKKECVHKQGVMQGEVCRARAQRLQKEFISSQFDARKAVKHENDDLNCSNVRVQNLGTGHLASISQSVGTKIRELYVRQKDGCRLKSNQLLKLLKPLYGLSDSVDYWHVTMRNHLVNDLQMHSLTGDLVYFIKCLQKKLTGMVGTYVNDLIAAGENDFQEETSDDRKGF